MTILLCCLPVAAASKIDDARELRQQGKLAAANDLLLSAAAEYKAAGDSHNLARALGIAADISLSLGRYEAAIQEAGEALQLRGSLHETASLGDDYNTIGLAYQYLSNYPSALDSYQKALAADRAAGDAEGEVTRLNNIGNVFYFRGHYSDALQSYQEAMQKLSAVPSTGATTSATSWTAPKRQLTLANLAVLFQRLGQEQRALDYYRQLADPRQFSEATGMPPGEKAQVLLNQGVLYRRLGDPVKALELYRAAQSLFQADRHPDGEIGALRNIGIVLAMDLNDVPGAVASFTSALNLATHLSNRRAAVQARLYRGECFRRAGRIEEAATDLAAALSDARQTGLVEEQWKSLHALGHIAETAGRMPEAGQDYREAISIIESMRAGVKLAPLRSDFLADKREVYDSLIDLRLRDGSVQPLEILNWMERSRAQTLLDRARIRASLPEPRMDRIQSQLDARTMLVEFWMGAGRAAAVWITRSKSGLVRYGDTSEWNAGAIADGRLMQDIPPAGHLIVVPDGVLSTVPFESLHISGSAGLLIERCEVSYLPSARFLKSKTPVRWRAPWSIELVAWADPLVSHDPLGAHWAPLPESAGEVRGIAETLAGRSERHLGADMRKSYLTVLAPGGAPLIHLATHAAIDAENPDRSRIVFANDYLSQEEVYDLNLTGVDLVTLSACDTARGRFVRGEGVQAFGQAFLAAGAASVVTTLWRVADGPTADFMKQFYYALSHGAAKGEALREAKLSFLHSHTALSDSRYWAAFILTGESESPIPRAVPWSACLFAAAVFLAAAVAARRIMVGRWTRQKL